MAKHRSPAYPNLTLSDAVQMVRTIYREEGRHMIPVEVIVQHGGYKNLKSSSALRLLGALGHYGLVVEEGRGDDRQMRLSDRSLDIVLAESEDSDQFRSALLEAVREPWVHQQIIQEYPEQLPSDGTLRSFLIRTLDFNDSQVDLFIKKFRDSVGYAGLYQDDINEEEQGSDDGESDGEGPKVGDFVQWTSQGEVQFESPRKVLGLSDDGQFAFVEGTETGLPVEQLTVESVQHQSATNPPVNPFSTPGQQRKPPAGVKRSVFPLDEGEAAIEWPESLSPASVEDFEAWFSLFIKKLHREAKVD